MEDYKLSVLSTRKGSLGGSDANMLKQIAYYGRVPQSAHKRLAICKGLIEGDNITTRQMAYGDFIENAIFEHLTEGNKEYISNPLWVSKKYSRKNVRLICHPDFVLFDHKKKVINVFECKATKFSVKATLETYRPQMFIEWLLGIENAKELGRDWKVKVRLVHYDSGEQDMNDEFTFDPNKISLCGVGFTNSNHLFDVGSAMDLVDDFLETFDFYAGDDEINSEYLPEKVKQEFDTITNILKEIKEREQKVEDFKKKLYDFMLEKNIKGIKNEYWSITRINPSESVSFDYKRFLEDYAIKYPRKAKKLLKTYEKRIQRKGSILMRLRNNNIND